MTTIDLLPESLQKKKRFRKLMIKLATAQVAVFLCLAAAVIGMYALEEQAWTDSHALNLQVHALRHGPEVLAAAYARDIGHIIAAEENFIAANFPPDFDPVWIKAILEASEGYLIDLNYGGASIFISGEAEEMGSIEALRQRLLYPEIFSSVRLGRISLLSDGRFSYELRVII